MERRWEKLEAAVEPLSRVQATKTLRGPRRHWEPFPFNHHGSASLCAFTATRGRIVRQSKEARCIVVVYSMACSEMPQSHWSHLPHPVAARRPALGCLRSSEIKILHAGKLVAGHWGGRPDGRLNRAATLKQVRPQRQPMACLARLRIGPRCEMGQGLVLVSIIISDLLSCTTEHSTCEKRAWHVGTRTSNRLPCFLLSSYHELPALFSCAVCVRCVCLSSPLRVLLCPTRQSLLCSVCIVTVIFPIPTLSSQRLSRLVYSALCSCLTLRTLASCLLLPLPDQHACRSQPQHLHLPAASFRPPRKHSRPRLRCLGSPILSRQLLLHTFAALTYHCSGLGSVILVSFLEHILLVQLSCSCQDFTSHQLSRHASLAPQRREQNERRRHPTRHCLRARLP
ncbi:hypothetical protein BJ546DRAFT_313492 [Cryomyces antarcticus]